MSEEVALAQRIFSFPQVFVLPTEGFVLKLTMGLLFVVITISVRA